MFNEAVELAKSVQGMEENANIRKIDMEIASSSERVMKGFEGIVCSITLIALGGVGIWVGAVASAPLAIAGSVGFVALGIAVCAGFSLMIQINKDLGDAQKAGREAEVEKILQKAVDKTVEEIIKTDLEKPNYFGEIASRAESAALSLSNYIGKGSQGVAIG